MKLLSAKELDLPSRAFVFRQSRLAGTVRGVGLCAVFLAAGPFLLLVGAPWFIWTPSLAVGILITLLLPRSVTALYRNSNWVMAVDDHSVWINLRSPFNRHLPDGLTVVRLETPDIENVSIYSAKDVLPDSDGGSVARTLKSLRFKLAHTDTQELAKALEDERLRKPVPGRFGSSGMSLHYPVTLPKPETILVAWRGSTMNDHVTLSASRALEILSANGLRVEEGSTSIQTKDWAQLEGSELDCYIREMALSGNAIEAIKILRLRRGLGLTDAKRRVEELSSAK